MESDDSCDCGGECVVWSPVVSVGDLPRLEVCDGLLDDPSDLVDGAVGGLLRGGECGVGRLLGGGEEAAADVAFVGDYLGRFESGQDIVGVKGDDVVCRAWQGIRYPPKCTVEGGEELDVDAGGVVLAGVQFGLSAHDQQGSSEPSITYAVPVGTSSRVGIRSARTVAKVAVIALIVRDTVGCDMPRVYAMSSWVRLVRK